MAATEGSDLFRWVLKVMTTLSDDYFGAILALIERHPDRWSDETLSIALAMNFAVSPPNLENALDAIERIVGTVVI